MKAVIPAAGQGTRLRPATLTMPKPIVPVANKWLIAYAIDTLKAAGLKDIGIIVNSMQSPIVDALGKGELMGVNIEYIVQTDQLGLAHAIGLAKDFIGDDAFTVFLGDNIFQDKMRDVLMNFESSDADATIALGEVPDPTRFGIAVIENNEIKGVVEKPKDPPGNLAIAGVYMFRPSIFDAITQIEPSWRGELEITDAIQVLIDGGKKVTPYTLKGWWIDAGKPDPIITANQLVMEDMPYTDPPIDENKIIGNSDVSHRVVVGEGSKIIDSVVRGPVIIGDNTTIKNSYVGPYTSIGNNSTIENAEIEASIIMDECAIKDIEGRIDRSLIAHKATITYKDQRPHSHRFVLAEYSIVEI